MNCISEHIRNSAAEVAEGKTRQTPNPGPGSRLAFFLLPPGRGQFGVLVGEEGWFGRARMAWVVPSVGRKTLVFSTARVAPSIGSQVERKGIIAEHPVGRCPRPKAALDPREVTLVSAVN